MAPVALEVIRPERRDDCGSLVVLDADPGRDELIDARRRATPSASIAVHVAEVPDGAAQMQPPLIFELCVYVGIGGPIGRKPTRRPVLPPVEIPKREIEERGPFLPVQ